MVKTELYFGRTIGTNGYVSDEQWDNFIKHVSTLYFPDGLTVLDAVGQWKMADGTIIKEHTKIVIVLHENNTNTDTIRNIYKNTFNQESVLRVDYVVDVQF